MKIKKENVKLFLFTGYTIAKKKCLRHLSQFSKINLLARLQDARSMYKIQTYSYTLQQKENKIFKIYLKYQKRAIMNNFNKRHACSIY